MKTALQQLNQIIGTSTGKIPINFIKSKIELLLEDEKKQIATLENKLKFIAEKLYRLYM